MRRIKILVNPTSGNTAGKRFFNTAKKFGPLCEVQTTDPHDILNQVKNFIAPGDIVIIAGGDGTVNLVINALYHTGLYQTVKVALFPLGTGNDLARHLKIKRTTLEHLIVNLENTTAIQLSLWRFNEHVFTNYISWGIDAWALKRVTVWRPKLPQRRWILQLAYLFSGLLTLFRWRKIQIVSPELSLEPKLLSIILCNGRSYAGGCPVAYEKTETPQLYLIKIRHHWDLINLMARRFFRKAYLTTPIQHETISIDTNSFDSEVDGEMLTKSDGTVTYCGQITFLVA